MRSVAAIAWKFAVPMVAIIGCAAGEPPPELMGIWTSVSERHRGRYLEISADHLAFGADQYHSVFYTIESVVSEEARDGTRYTIEYSGVGGARRQLVIRYAEGNPPTVELENQGSMWTRKTQDAPNVEAQIQ